MTSTLPEVSGAPHTVPQGHFWPLLPFQAKKCQVLLSLIAEGLQFSWLVALPHCPFPPFPEANKQPGFSKDKTKAGVVSQISSC